jgi:tRNA threonylcarbamoyladenosine biosynthesis protein TsaE
MTTCETILLTDEDATARMGAALGRALRPGDVLLLEGPLGAGKSALARAAILARLAEEGRVEETPSPTYTLVQTYPSPRGDIWHADLYRLSGPGEALELGLTEAFGDAICLIEWPDRLGAFAPARAMRLRLGFPPSGEGRVAELIPRGEGWDAALAAARSVA